MDHPLAKNLQDAGDGQNHTESPDNGKANTNSFDVPATTESLNQPTVSDSLTPTANQLTNDQQQNGIDIFGWLSSLGDIFNTAESHLTFLVACLALVLAYRANSASQAANKIAGQELSVTRESTVLDMQPYLSMKFNGCERYTSGGTITVVVGDSDEKGGWNPNPTYGFWLEIDIINSGKTPASDLIIDFDGPLSSFWVEGKVNNETVMNEVYKGFTPRPSFAAAGFLMTENSSITARFSVEVKRTRGIAFCHCTHPSNAFSFSGAVIDDIVIRYKDFTTDNTEFHKMVRGSLIQNVTRGTDSTGGVFWSEKRHDSECQHYVELAERRKKQAEERKEAKVII